MLSGTSLGFRLGSTLAVALLPLGLLSMMQARVAQSTLEDSTLDGALGASLRVAETQVDLITDAQVTARTFAASLSESPSDGAVCARRAKAVAATIPQASLVAFIPMTGLMTCSSNEVEHDFSNNPLFQQMIANPEASLVYNPRGPVTGTAVVGAGYPVFAEDDSQSGIVTVSLPYAAITPDAFRDDVAGFRPTYVATITRDGQLLIASDPERDLAAALPEGLGIEDLPERVGSASFERDREGHLILSVAPVGKELFLVTIWQASASGILGPFSAFAPYLLPGLTWIAALAVAGFASSRLVVRHVRGLSRSMTDYLSNRSRGRIPDVSDAPAEIQRLHAAYEQLVRTIEQDEAELQNLIVDKDALLREVNHRSGNSLQIIASIMRMYRRESHDPAIHDVLDGMINRVIALSSTHTSLYDLSGQRHVSVDKVVLDVIGRLKQIHRIAVNTTDKRLQTVRSDAPTAVGVAMIAAEAVGAFFTRSGLTLGEISVRLEETDGRIMLQVSGPAVPQFRSATETGILSLPRRMIRQLAAQLGGTVRIDEVDDRITVTMEAPNPSSPAP